MQTAAEAWLVYRLTGSALWLGVIGFASQFPVFLVAPIGGIVADRNNRHKVVIWTQVFSMIFDSALAVLTLAHVVTKWHVLILAILMGIVSAFDIPARQSFLVDMVGKEDLMNAIALNSSMFNGARIIGPSIAAILIAKVAKDGALPSTCELPGRSRRFVYDARNQAYGSGQICIAAHSPYRGV